MKKKIKSFNVHVYGILDKKLEKITKVSLDEEEIRLDLDLDNHDGKLVLCDFNLKVKLAIDCND